MVMCNFLDKCHPLPLPLDTSVIALEALPSTYPICGYKVFKGKNKVMNVLKIK